MKHVRMLGRTPLQAQTEGLCTNIVSDLQARYCFVLSFFSSVFVPIIQPFITLKTDTAPEETPAAE